MPRRDNFFYHHPHMRPRIIIINGPAQSGKDTVGALVEAFTGAYRTKFAKALKDRAHAMLGLDVAHDHFETQKDTQLAVFGGMTPRQFYIYFSEDVVKPVFGKRYFGEITLEDITMQVNYGRAVVVTDSGFPDEALPVCEAYPGQVELWQTHREGRTFRGDSRTYIELPDIEPEVITNNGTVQDLLIKVEGLLYR